MSQAQATLVQELNATVLELINRVEALEKALAAKPAKAKSETEMTESHAYECIFGDNKDLSHKACAEKMGLTYGQIYSARLGFTFKTWLAAQKAEGKVNGWIKA